MVKTDLPKEFRFFEVAEELGEVGLDPEKTRLVCVAVNASETVRGADKYPEIQIVMVPFKVPSAEDSYLLPGLLESAYLISRRGSGSDNLKKEPDSGQQ